MYSAVNNLARHYLNDSPQPVLRRAETVQSQNSTQLAIPGRKIASSELIGLSELERKMPPDLKTRIFLTLDIKSFAQLRSVSTRFYAPTEPELKARCEIFPLFDFSRAWNPKQLIIQIGNIEKFVTDPNNSHDDKLAIVSTLCNRGCYPNTENLFRVFPMIKHLEQEGQLEVLSILRRWISGSLCYFPCSVSMKAFVEICHEEFQSGDGSKTLDTIYDIPPYFVTGLHDSAKLPDAEKVDALIKLADSIKSAWAWQFTPCFDALVKAGTGLSDESKIKFLSAFARSKGLEQPGEAMPPDTYKFDSLLSVALGLKKEYRGVALAELAENLNFLMYANSCWESAFGSLADECVNLKGEEACTALNLMVGTLQFHEFDNESNMSRLEILRTAAARLPRQYKDRVLEACSLKAQELGISESYSIGGMLTYVPREAYLAIRSFFDAS